MTNKISLIWLVILVFNGYSFCKDKVINLTQEIINNEATIYFVSGWKYHSGDSLHWASPHYNDANWENVDTRLEKDNLPISGWNGKGWFRVHFNIDSLLYNQTVRLLLRSAGKQSIYLDGKYITDRSDWKNPKVIRLPAQSEHVFAVKFENPDAEYFFTAGYQAGFSLGVGDLERITKSNIEEANRYRSEQIFFTAITLAFGLLHLILYLYNKKFKENLIYSIFLFLYAASIFVDYQNNLSINIPEQLTFLRVHRTIMPLTNIFVLLSLYSMLKQKVTKSFRFVLGYFTFATVLAVIKPESNFIFLQFGIILMLIESFRILHKSFREKVEGVWIIAAGFSILFVFSFYDWLVDMQFVNQIRNINNGYPFGTIGLFICMSVFLAKSFAKTNFRIIQQERIAQEQEIEKKYLEAENKRKSMELEDARKLQLSILPKSFPDFANLEIQADMRTAAEVGGDYYDYHLSNDGTLTITIGDATGHGIKAGIMVTLIKSLFDAMAHTFFIPDFFNHCTKTIKKMNLGNLYMAMTVLKIQDYRITASAAGMPPFLIYRKAKGIVEEFIMKGMPLGAHNSFQYQQTKFVVHPGDIILLLSDGFVELFNANRQMLDYDSAKGIFCEAASKYPDKIISYLFEAGDKWLNGFPQADDITFVVIKIK